MYNLSILILAIIGIFLNSVLLFINTILISKLDQLKKENRNKLVKEILNDQFGIEGYIDESGVLRFDVNDN